MNNVRKRKREELKEGDRKLSVRKEDARILDDEN